MSTILNSKPGSGRLSRAPAACLLAIVLGVLLAACQDSPFTPPWTPPPEPPPPAQPLIAFASNREGGQDIYTMREDGSEVRRLTVGMVASVPRWSPDRTRLAFSSLRHGDSEIYVMNADGSSPVRLTTSPGKDDHPAWSPDGRRIAFMSDRTGRSVCTNSGCVRNTQIHVMNADGSGEVRLTEPTAALPGDSEPVWSPDGRSIAFTSTRDTREGLQAIFVMNSDGGEVRRLSGSTGTQHSAPAWSPDGQRIAFVCGAHLCVMNAGGGEPVQITQEQGASRPAWAPDGRRLVFGQGADLFVVNDDGSGLRRLTESPPPTGPFVAPAWSPDGDVIAFMSRKSAATDLFTITPEGTDLKLLGSLSLPSVSYGTSVWAPDGQRIAVTFGTAQGADIYVVTRDGSRWLNVSDHPGRDDWPAWSPDGTRLVFHSGRSGREEIHVVHADGGGLRQLTHDGYASFPHWSPDGNRIVFSRGSYVGTSYEQQIYVMNPDGSGLTRLTPQVGLRRDSWFPRWSPDGRRIALVGFDELLTFNHVYVMNVDGSGATKVTDRDSTYHWHPVWSPDGNEIAFTMEARWPPRLTWPFYVGIARSDGSGQSLITPPDQPYDRNPSWSPDGRQLVFERVSSIYIANADGSGQRVLVRAQPYTFSRDPTW